MEQPGEEQSVAVGQAVSTLELHGIAFSYLLFLSLGCATVRHSYSLSITCRVTTCLENLEMSGNLTAVREMSGILLKIREMSEFSGEKSCQGKVA